MRRIITCFLAVLFLSFFAAAQQVPNGFNYQSIARDALGLPIVNSQINLRITVRQNSISGTDVWQETQSATTNQFGLINLVIGNGTKTGGLASITGINGIDWASDKFFIIVEVNNGGAYVSLGITQFQSVPYALAADNALKIQGTKVGPIPPAANQFLKFNAISGAWEPGNISGANGGTVISVGGIGPITITGNTGLDPQIGILQSSAIQDGYLSALDWAVFANKLGTTTGFSGNVTGTYDAITVTGIQNISVSAIAPTNGQILMYDGIQWTPTTTGASASVITVTGSGEISVTPGTSPIISVSTASGTGNGIITMADYISFSNKLSVNSIAGGDLSGPYNNLLINSIGGVPISLASAPAGAVLSFNGIGFVPALISSAINISSTTPGVSASGSVINIATADGITMGLLAPGDYNRFGNKVGPATSLTGGDVAGSYQDGFTVTGLGTKSLSINGILPGQVLSFNGTSFVPGTPAASQLTSVTGINGIIVGGSGTLYSIDGSNLLTVTTLFGGDLNGSYNAITVNRIQSVPFSMAGIVNGQYLYYNGTSIVGSNIPVATVPTIVGINGITLNTNTGYNFTISGQTLATYSGDNLLTTLTGAFPNFTIAGISQAQNATTLTGAKGLSVVGSGFSQTIVGQSFIGTGGIVVSSTGNTFTISNTTPGLSLFGDGVSTSVTGSNNNYTVLGIGSNSQWISTSTGVYIHSFVGIGTSTPPTMALTVQSASSPDVAFFESFNSGGSTINVYNGGTDGARIKLSSVSTLILENRVSVAGFNFYGNDFFTFNAVNSLIGINANGGVVNIGRSGLASDLSVTGITYTKGLKINSLANGILTVDGLGNVTTTSLNFPTTPTTLMGTNGLSVAGSGFSQTIVGQSFIGTNGIVVSSTGNTFTISNTTPGLSLFGDNVRTSVVGINNNYTVLGIGISNQWVSTTSGNIFYSGGKIGIGNVNPVSDIHIFNSASSSNLRIESTTSTGASGITLATDSQTWTTTIHGSTNSSGNSGEYLLYDNTSFNTRFRVMPGTGNIVIGGPTVAANEKLTVEGNATILGVGYANAFSAAKLTLTGIGSGILTVDGFGNVTTTSLSFSTTQTTLTGSKGLSVSGSGFSQTIIGQSLIGANGIVVSSTGNTFTISNTTPGLSLFGDNVNTSVVGANNNYTVLGIGSGSQWVTTTGGIYYPLGVGINSSPLTTPSTAPLTIGTSSTWDIAFVPGGGGSATIHSVQDLFLLSDANLTFSTNSSDRLKILSTGQVGIGTLTPNEELTVQGNSSVSGISYASGFRGSALTLTGIGSGIITVDGFGNLTTTSLNLTSSQWINTTAGIYYDKFVGIGTVNPGYPLHISTVTNAVIRVDNGFGAVALYPNGVEYAQYFAIKINTFGGVGNTTGGNVMLFDANQNVAIGNLTDAVERLTVQGNSSVTGIGYSAGIRTQTLTLTGIGSGILTVDGFGNVTTTSLNLSSVFTQSVAGNSFTNDNIVIQGATTPGIAKLKVKGDLSAGGQLIASQTMNPTGTASTTVTGATLFKQRIYIPQGTNTLNASFNAYEFVGAGNNGIIFIYINGAPVGSVTFTAPNDQTTTMTISNILVVGLSGFQNLEIRGKAGNASDGVILQGYTLVIND